MNCQSEAARLLHIIIHFTNQFQIKKKDNCFKTMSYKEIGYRKIIIRVKVLHVEHNTFSFVALLGNSVPMLNYVDIISAKGSLTSLRAQLVKPIFGKAWSARWAINSAAVWPVAAKCSLF